ncbi:MAG: response regulator transcription factor [Chloroflexi bacterium]|nr:response regulator transcription factor [Ardenticatenaceae bacterium]MBL1130702.1 DNA-binding response regulator [Chloroflexota bacterium]NOG36795.1 response regulator transcription factor [Chloroflexota bacterium]GIK57880.1 MAG: DNA-binding response regulator [Chloroflexota bacterium]
MTTLLLIDDDEMITGPLVRQFTQAGYGVLVAHNGRDGLSIALSQNPDLVLLDVMMPEMDGWEVCRRLRQQSVVPILMLTALGEEVDRILGLELGADDYLPKPFSTRELQARVRALLRRVELDRAAQPTTVLTAGDIHLELETRQVSKNGRPLTLRFKEFELLSLLLSRPGQVISRTELFDKVWGTDWLGDTRTLDVHVRWLREKIEDDPGQPRYIQTVRGVGYRFAAPELP